MSSFKSNQLNREFRSTHEELPKLQTRHCPKGGMSSGIFKWIRTCVDDAITPQRAVSSLSQQPQTPLNQLTSTAPESSGRIPSMAAHKVTEAEPHSDAGAAAPEVLLHMGSCHLQQHLQAYPSHISLVAELMPTQLLCKTLRLMLSQIWEA